MKTGVFMDSRVVFASLSTKTRLFMDSRVIFAPLSTKTGVFMDSRVVFAPLSTKSGVFMDRRVVFASLSMKTGVFMDSLVRVPVTKIADIYEGSTFMVMCPSYLYAFSNSLTSLLIASFLDLRDLSFARLTLSILMCLSATLLTAGA